jgi:hypothetical protein
VLQAVQRCTLVMSSGQWTCCPLCYLPFAQVYVIDTVLIPEDDLSNIPQTIPAGASKPEPWTRHCGHRLLTSTAVVCLIK